MSLPHAFSFRHILYSFCYADGSVGGEVAVILKHGQNKKAEFGQASKYLMAQVWHGIITTVSYIFFNIISVLGS